MKYFLHIGYNGSKYHGWQFQPNVLSVQEVLEKTLFKIIKSQTNVLGCGRTDAGVHASQYVLHIELKDAPNFDLKFRLNKNLPSEIIVYDVVKVDEECHARYDATSRTYEYFLHFQEDPFLSPFSSFYDLENLDFESMKKAAEILPQFTDFKTVCKQPELHNHTRCNITHSKLYVDEVQQRIRFSITADRFLRGMIRLLVWYFLKIGKREMSLDEFQNLMSNQLEEDPKIPALPNGLYLAKIEYPYISFEQQNDMCSLLKKGLE